MSAPPEAYTYTGPWINWSRGAIRGATITLNQRQGGLLIAFLGIFVTFAGAATWRILSYCLHQSRAKQGSRNALYHQQQLVLRNSSTSGAALWQMSQIFWAWRKLASKPLVRSLPFILLAFCNMTLFTVAGVFSSEVTKAAGNETLIMSPGCGYQLPGTNLSSAGLFAIDANGSLAAGTYSNACYGNSFNSFQCNQFVKPRLDWTTKRNVSCPFQADLCVEGPTSAFEMDSGMLDTRDDLGINTPDADRLQYRHVTSCSVLNGSAHTTTRNVTRSDGSNRTFSDYNFRLNGSAEGVLFTYNKQDAFGSSSYALTPFHFPTTARASPPSIVPIPEISRDDADVTIMFLAGNGVWYTEPIYDPWFRATIKEEWPDPDENRYSSNYYVRPLACTDQYQYCNPHTSSCTPLTGRFLVNDGIDILGLSPLQEAILLDLHNSIFFQSTFDAVYSRGAAALRASETLQGSVLTHVGMPSDQWITEVNHWFALGLARLQQLMVDYATGPAYLQEGGEIVKGNKDLCRRQKVRSTSGYLSFSILGVTIILALGALLMLIALCVDTVVGFGMRKLGFKDHKRRQWAQDEKMQLLRLAYQGVGQGHWSGETEAVPVTSRDQPLGELEACFGGGYGAEGQMQGETEACIKAQNEANGGDEYAYASPQMYAGGQPGFADQYDAKGWSALTIQERA